MTAHEFAPWPKTTRLFRDIVVTEKIDGTNAAIHISALRCEMEEWTEYPPEAWSCVVDGVRYVISAQSRKRIITPGKTTDNYGFAGWVYDNAAALVSLLGEGLHFGEWWGQGIQRGYGLDERRFSLFNTERHGHIQDAYVGAVRVGSVPVLYQGPNDTAAIRTELHCLKTWGSAAVPGFLRPEGVCVYHSASRTVTKVTLDANDAGKWEVDA
ncbi:RNA ligase family protein [Streptomyces europaeiscabiei]|uniref:RNA ligase family protein n=1 Tax=Streptomyces europaeiscabiei TaxID=146819 RepID=A0ABU4N5Y2_9ACTN|nr:RNA ligase family protein [Streptomyces europaeiscabiei]MDX3551000.1 RNA ligase family protein [Streptomyces europaeiscabiei]MDX3698440.1 RNA ligase family protein [Streptomyces europaeiscabiei]